VTVAAAIVASRSAAQTRSGIRLIGFVAVHRHRCSGCEVALLAVTPAAQRGVPATGVFLRGPELKARLCPDIACLPGAVGTAGGDRRGVVQ
jgi:hypothetical protein